jgi:hypothetical protein
MYVRVLCFKIAVYVKYEGGERVQKVIQRDIHQYFACMGVMGSSRQSPNGQYAKICHAWKSWPFLHMCFTAKFAEWKPHGTAISLLVGRFVLH